MTPIQRAQITSAKEALLAIDHPPQGVRYALDILGALTQESGTVEVWLTEAPSDANAKIFLIKAIREMTQIGLAEAKRCTETLPQCLGRFPADHAGIFRLRVAGGLVELRAPA